MQYNSFNISNFKKQNIPKKKKRNFSIIDMMFKPKDYISKESPNKEQEVSRFFIMKSRAYQDQSKVLFNKILDEDYILNTELLIDSNDKITVMNNDALTAVKKIFGNKDYQRSYLELYYDNRSKGIKHTIAKKNALEQLKKELTYEKSIFYETI